MIFGFETEELTLYIFPDEVAAVSYCEGIDVEAAIWLFWNDDGTPLSAEFTVPNKRGVFSVTNGKYHFVQNPEFIQAPLLEALENIQSVEGQPPFNTITAIKQYLTSRSRKTPT